MINYFCIKDFKDIKSFKDMYYNYINHDNSYLLLKKSKDFNISEGDLIYVAFLNLPDKSNRLFIRCKVKKIDGNNIYVGSIRAVSNKLYNEFDIKELKSNYKKNNLYDFPKKWENKLDQFIKGLSNPKEYFSLRNLKDYYYVFKCECCGKTETYENTNHVQGAEFHHFIPRCTLKSNIKDDFIDSENNYAMLCPNCHFKIHHVELNERKRLIKQLFDNKKDLINNKTNKKYVEEVKEYIKGICNKTVNTEDEIVEWLFPYYLNDREEEIVGIKKD